MLISQNLRRAARMAPERVAYVSGTTSRTWGELANAIPRIAGGLLHAGLEPGDRIAILSNNSAAFFELYLAAPWAGLVMVSLNTRWSVREMTDALNDCGAKYLVVDQEFWDIGEVLKEAESSVEHLILSGEMAATHDLHWGKLAAASPVTDCQANENDPAYIFYTGGTTGQAKGVILSAMNFHIAGLSSLHTGGYTADSILSISVPLFHMSGGGLIAAQLAVGASAHLIPKFEPQESMASVELSRATHVVWVPTMLSMLLESAEFGKYDLSSLQRIFYGSSPMPASLIRRAIEAMPDVAFTQYYGMTEVTGNATWLGPKSHSGSLTSERLTSVGIAIPGVEVKIVKSDGEDAEPGETGEVCIKGPTVMLGYWGRPAETLEAIKDGWMHTGDLARMDKDGHFFLVDRLKDMIVSGGENVYSREVENALYQHPAIMECGVIGLPHPKWGEVVSAIIYLWPDCPVEAVDLITHCRPLIAAYKTPKMVFFSPAPLSKSAAGKILKADLRQQYMQDADSVSNQLVYTAQSVY